MPSILRCLIVSHLLSIVAAISSAASAAEHTRPVEEAPLTPESASHFEDAIRPVLVEYCSACHDPESAENHVDFLKSARLDDVAANRHIWKSVAEQLRNRTMPPADEAQPPEEDRLRIAEWIDRTMRATACRQGEYAGNVTTRRLNREEYDHTLRDLLGIELHASDLFPVDGSGGEGFDNNGETLFLPPILMERYLEAATEALDATIISPRLDARFRASDLLPPLPTGSHAVTRTVDAGQEVTALVRVYASGEYAVSGRAATRAEHPTALALKVDGIAAERFTIQPSAPNESPSEFTTIVSLSRGIHTLALGAASDSAVEVGDLRVVSYRKSLTAGDVSRHFKLTGLRPGQTHGNARAAARERLASFMRSAFRRPVTSGEIDRLMTLYDRAAERGDPFEESLKLALKGVLVSPSFLFRVESQPASAEIEPIDDHELAVRLSYFLWTTMPDEKLSRLADAGRLHEPAVLSEQVDRMLDDARSAAFAESFVGQWLGTREVGARVAPDTNAFDRQFTTELLLDFREEPVWFFKHLLAGNRSLLELLDSDYVIVNERLGRQYGLITDGERIRPQGNPWSNNPQRGTGGSFREMKLVDDRRGGVLGMGGVHLLTSYPDRTSPVLRGGWILETLLGIRVPSPPPDVPQLVRGRKEKASVRDQLAAHRDNVSCAACHNLMDPLGFALDNFDVLGRWRDKDGQTPIDASATLPSGESFTGPEGLRQVLLERKDDFLRQLTGKMLGFALGRSLADGDDCTVNQIADTVRQSDYRARVLVREIALSTPFRYRQQVGESVQAKAASEARSNKQRTDAVNRRLPAQERRKEN